MKNFLSEKHKKSIVIIPCYNEAENIGKLILEILKFEKSVDVLVVNDSSEDQTKEITEKLAKKYKNKIFIINRTGERSFAKSYVEGFRWALSKKYGFIFQMDGDFSHNPKYLPVFLEQMKNYDLVIGSRYLEKKSGGKSWGNNKRIIFSVLANFYTRAITRLPINDITGGFKCFRRQVLKKIDLENISAKGFAFQTEINWMVFKSGFKIGEIQIDFFDRKYGKSKLSFGKIIEGLWIPIRISLR